MRNTMMWAAALVLITLTTAARAEGPVPPVMVGPVAITGREAEEMIQVLARHRHARYRAGDSLDWLMPSAVQPTPTPGMPPVVVNGVVVVGREAEAMIGKLSRMRHHGRYRAGMSLDWLGIATPMMMPVAPMPLPVAPVVAQPQVVYLAPPPVIVAPPVVERKARKDEPNLRRFIVSLTGQGNSDHASLGLGVTFEGKRWGFNLNGGGTVYDATNDRTRRADLKLVDAHLVFAPIVGERGRARLELGAAVAVAEGAWMIAPDVGVSGDVRIWGPLGITGSLRGAFWPYQRLDGFLGAYAQLWVFRLEGGWREMRLEAALPEGAGRISECWSGPYLGATLVF